MVGRPVLHSRSPQLYDAAFRDAGLDAVYTRLVADSATEALRLARQIGMAGLSVSAPFKAGMLPLLDRVDDGARALGAVNTVVLRDGEAAGTDTDPDGVRAMLRESGVEAGGKRVVLLGAGGAARAAAHTLAGLDAAEVTFVARNPERGRDAAESLGGRFAPWDDAPTELKRAELLISCVPAGVDAVRRGWLEPGLPILDACYVRSALAERAAAEGWNYLGGGLAWLIGQAHASYRHFTGSEPPAEAMTRALVAATARGRPTHIALCGMMGAGKSVTGTALADALGRSLVDTDAQIEEGAGATVAQIFQRDGEVIFRAREALAIRGALDGVPAVIALGGGALLDAQVRDRVRDGALVVWLWADPETCARRARGGTRPLLGKDAPVAAVVERLAERLPGYARAADLLAATGEHSPQHLAAHLAEEFASAWPD